jgi:hypothetical protein
MDYLAAGGPISAQAIANVAEYMFDHQSGDNDPLGTFFRMGINSFSRSCDISHLQSIKGSFTHVPGTGRIQVNESFEPPRKRICSLSKDLQDVLVKLPPDLRHLRFPEHLLMTNSLRIQFLSIQASWKSFRSGILCWGAFMDSMFPYEDHMIVSLRAFRSYAPFFSERRFFQSVS